MVLKFNSYIARKPYHIKAYKTKRHVSSSHNFKPLTPEDSDLITPENLQFLRCIGLEVLV